MMKLSYQMKGMNLWVLLVSLFFITYGCNEKKSEKKVIKNQDRIEKQSSIKQQDSIKQKIFNYKKEELFYTIELSFEKKRLSALFFLNQNGEFGDLGFEKKINVILLNNNKIFDKIDFSNASVLCDVEMLSENIDKVFIEESSNENLFFLIVESCDGEEPDVLQIIFWNGNFKKYSFEIPKYFESNEDEKKFLEKFFKQKKMTNPLFKNISKKLVKNYLEQR